MSEVWRAPIYFPKIYRTPFCFIFFWGGGLCIQPLYCSVNAYGFFRGSKQTSHLSLRLDLIAFSKHLESNYHAPDKKWYFPHILFIHCYGDCFTEPGCLCLKNPDIGYIGAVISAKWHCNCKCCYCFLTVPLWFLIYYVFVRSLGAH